MRRPFNRIYNLGAFPWGGDSNTVAQAAVAPLDPTSNPGFIASLRMTVDVGNWDDARFILPGGQSGNPLSPHYADQLPLWLRGETVTIPFSPKPAAEVARETLELVPLSR